jgi:chaperonin GroES
MAQRRLAGILNVQRAAASQRIRRLIRRSHVDLKERTPSIMTVNLRPLGDRVVVAPKPKDDVTASGIVLPDTVTEKPQEGSVRSVGTGRVLDNGTRIAMEVKVGDTVLFARYAGTEVKLEGEDYLVIREADVLGIVTTATNGKK